MVHKIKGWARDFVDHGTGYELGNGGGWAEFSEDGKEEFGDVPCTLVTTHERLFTESEVRAYEKDLIKALFDPGGFTERHREEKVIGQSFEETVPQWVSRARAIVRSRHGLFDPA